AKARKFSIIALLDMVSVHKLIIPTKKALRGLFSYTNIARMRLEDTFVSSNRILVFRGVFRYSPFSLYAYNILSMLQFTSFA
ncbi:hypothetical protein, partial [Veillonella ratti]|uniref:hypothetical protein n=1 Tax=Veillonella ratti TaxID=103892 RepID=UPI0034A478A0